MIDDGKGQRVALVLIPVAGDGWHIAMAYEGKSTPEIFGTFSNSADMLASLTRALA